MVIDFHTHIFPDAIASKTISLLEGRSGIPASTDGTLQGLSKSMDQTGIDLSVILPVVTRPSQFESINVFAKGINENYAGRFISFGGIHPDSEDYKGQLRTIKEMGLPGIKLHPDYQGVMIDDIRYMNIIEYASELDLIVLTHAGVDSGLPYPIHCPPDKMRKVIDTIKPEKLVVAHYGGWKQWELAYEYLADADVYFDTAVTFGYLEQEMFLKMWEKVNKEKVLFASDSPWSEPVVALSKVRELPISQKEKDDLLGNNAKKLLGIK